MKEQVIRLGRSALVYGVGGMLNRFLNFLLLPVFTAYLTPVDYGLLSMLFVVSFLATPVFSLGFSAALAPCYFEPGDPGRKPATLWTATTLLAASTGAMILIGVLAQGAISRAALGTAEHGPLVVLTLLAAGCAILAEPWGHALRFEDRARAFVVLSSLSSLVTIGACALLVVGFGRGVRGMLEGGLIGQAATLVLYFAPWLGRFRYAFRGELARELLRQGLPLVPGFACLFVLFQGSKYALQWLGGLDEVGVYTVGYNLGMAMGLAVAAFQSAWLPYFMSFVDRRTEARPLFGRVLTFYVLGFGALSLAFALFGRTVVLLLTQPAYHEAFRAVGFSAGSQFVSGVFSVLLPAVYFAKEVWVVTAVQSGAAALSVGCSLLLIPPFGITGAGVALLLGTLAMAALQHAWNVRRGERYFAAAYEWDRVARFAAFYVPVLGLTVVPRDWTIGTECAAAVLASLVLAPVAWFGLLPARERAAIRVALRDWRTLGAATVPAGAGEAVGPAAGVPGVPGAADASGDAGVRP